MRPVLGKVEDGEDDLGREAEALLEHELGDDDVQRRGLVGLRFGQGGVVVGRGRARRRGRGRGGFIVGVSRTKIAWTTTEEAGLHVGEEDQQRPEDQGRQEDECGKHQMDGICIGI